MKSEQKKINKQWMAKMDSLTIVNYQGSKKNLLEFIHSNLDEYISNKDVILDIFSGTASVAYSYKRTNTVYTNDAESYAAVMAKALLGEKLDLKTVEEVKQKYSQYKNPTHEYDKWIRKEKLLVEKKRLNDLIELYESIPTVWNTHEKCFGEKTEYSLFMKYYSTNYLGLAQARDIDAIRWAIEETDTDLKEVLLSCLFFAIKECVFSKDGHMAQPLDFKKNATRLFRLREKNLYSLFLTKINDFINDDFVIGSSENKVFNYNFEELLDREDELRPVTVIYADPPYTDMQYSRYYHLLNTVVEYNYPDMTEIRGSFTKGLYLDNRFQSQLSRKKSCLEAMEKLIRFSKKNNITLAISFAYPKDVEIQKTDRYVMDIKDLIAVCKRFYSEKYVHIRTQDYEHSNNRNSATKKVIEYLIICERDGK